MSNPPTILVVDDNRAVLAALKQALEEASFRVLTADDGDRAVGTIVKQKPDLIISDIQMPNLDGFFLCQIVRSRPETRSIPFIFLTALDAPPKRAHGFKLGADDFIPKPFDKAEVVMRVKNVLKKAYGNAAAGEAAPDGASIEPRTETVRGSVSDFPLSDLLQMVNLNQKSGRIHLERPGEKAERGAIDVAHGSVLGVTAGRQIGLKGFCRLFTWRDATFRVEYDREAPSPANTRSDLGPIEELTMTALFQRIEFDSLAARLGGIDQMLEEDPEHEVPEGEIDANGKYILLLVQRHASLIAVIDESGLTDLDTVKAVSQLFATGVLRRVPGSVQP